MNQVEELVKVVAEAQTDKGNVVIVTGKPGSGKSKVLRKSARLIAPFYKYLRLI